MVGIRLPSALRRKRAATFGSHVTTSANIGFAVGLRRQRSNYRAETPRIWRLRL
jgi:hypothetical protein